MDSFEKQDTVDLNINVKEQSTGSLVIGGGFSSALGATANIGISENNLLGKSQRISLNILASERENRADFSFTEPFFLDRNASITNNIFTTVQEYPESNRSNESYIDVLFLSYNIGEYGSQSIGYTLGKKGILLLKIKLHLQLSQ